VSEFVTSDKDRPLERAGHGMGTAAVSIIGFDSAWTDSPKAPGALCTIRIDGAGRRTLVQPALVSFDQALATIAAETAPLRIVALDQPTLVPNATGMRPVDRVAASLISWLGGGVQPANRAKIGMFDDAAPIWRFKERLAAIEDPEASRTASAGLYLMEVFPALALPSLEPGFDGRLRGPRYNPARRKTFALASWRAVIASVRRQAIQAGIAELADWADALDRVETPRKADQDRIDAVLCALIGLHWLVRPRDASIMIGDLGTGYMIAPASPSVRARLEAAARVCAVPVDPGRRPTGA
jgi:predicted RNase H-like nuclease